MTIGISDIRIGEVFIEDPTEQKVIVKEIRPLLGRGPEREIYLESPEKPGCGVWQDEELFASIHSKLPAQKIPAQKRGFFARLFRLR